MEEDVHSPLQDGFLYAHIGWLMKAKSYPLRLENLGQYENFPELYVLETMALPVGSSMFFTIGFHLYGGNSAAFMALAISNNAMWSINSLCHMKFWRGFTCSASTPEPYTVPEPRHR